MRNWVKLMGTNNILSVRDLLLITDALSAGELLEVAERCLQEVSAREITDKVKLDNLIEQVQELRQNG